MFAEDLDAFYDADELAVTASFGAQTAPVYLDMPAEEVIDGHLSVEYRMRWRADQLTGLGKGHQLTIGASTYTLREDPRPITDGAECVARLTRN